MLSIANFFSIERFSPGHDFDIVNYFSGKTIKFDSITLGMRSVQMIKKMQNLLYMIKVSFHKLHSFINSLLYFSFAIPFLLLTRFVFVSSLCASS